MFLLTIRKAHYSASHRIPKIKHTLKICFLKFVLYISSCKQLKMTNVSHSESSEDQHKNIRNKHTHDEKLSLKWLYSHGIIYREYFIFNIFICQRQTSRFVFVEMANDSPERLWFRKGDEKKKKTGIAEGKCEKLALPQLQSLSKRKCSHWISRDRFITLSVHTRKRRLRSDRIPWN